MKNHFNFDFFSSPHTHLIPFSDIRHPYHELNNQEDQQSAEKSTIKHSFNQQYQAIKPWHKNFFNQRPEEEEDQFQSLSCNRLHFNELTIKSDLNIDVESNQQNSGGEFNVNSYSSIRKNLNKIYETPKKIRKHKQNVGQTTVQKQKGLYLTNERQKIFSRSNEKGLRKLSSLAFSIVCNSITTTYKEVAVKLLNKLNIDCDIDQICMKNNIISNQNIFVNNIKNSDMDNSNNDMNEEQSRIQRSSMQNVKRRVYDSLNVLIALGVIKRVGNKISRQKNKKILELNKSCYEMVSQSERYQDLISAYENHLMDLEEKKKTEKELKQKLEMFRKIIERNKKPRQTVKNKSIKLPFLIFVSKKQNYKSKQQGLRNKNSNKNQNVKQFKENFVEMSYDELPESYGDLDFFRLMKNAQDCQKFFQS